MKKISFVFFLLMMLCIPQLAEASSGGTQLIIINKSTNKLAFYENGELVKIFPVATGRTNSLTPEGKFPIVNKIKNRPYYKEGIPGGSPKNPLGDRWLGLDARGTYGTTYAIHGNNNANSIGKYVSAGCVRMHNADIHWLFDRVKLYTNVVIINSSKTFDAIAKANGYPLSPPIKIVIDGKELNVNVPPYMENNRVMVPMRSIFNEIGATVKWQNDTKSITATKGNDEIKLKVNSKEATKNGNPITLDVAPAIRESTTFVPTRFVSESLGIQVKWDSKKRTVTLIVPPPKEEPVRTTMSVSVNGKTIDPTGYIEEGITMIPIQTVFSHVGANIQYEAVTSTLSIDYQQNHLKLTAGKSKAIFNDTTLQLPKSVEIIGGRMYAPSRAIIELFSGTIFYNQNTLAIQFETL